MKNVSSGYRVQFGIITINFITSQVRLSDEQSTVRAVRLQQRKALEGQQRLVEEDLSRYMYSVRIGSVIHIALIKCQTHLLLFFQVTERL